MSSRTVIIEDETVFRQMLALALGRITGLRLIGELADGREGLEFCLREKPDLLVVDLFLPGMHGLEIVKIVREKLPATRILVLTSHPDGELPSQLIRQGVHGFVDKTAPLNYVLQAVESVMKGGMFFAANVPPRANAAASDTVPVRPAPQEQPPQSAPSLAAAKTLTPREIEVARLVSEGLSSKEVASQLNLSVRTVEKHRANIMDKLGVREVASLVRYCIQAGIVKS
jgi:DNA-binding NarL/FixJ family response regulator|uniref:response regulator n=1 Tax=Cephaloticoccus sp. TaxID=1985742 RepID=UPI00404A5241